MTPTIEQIIADLLAGAITREQAIEWLRQHVELAREVAENDYLRDSFAMSALQGWLSANMWIDGEPVNGGPAHAERVTGMAYEWADAMIKARAA